MSLWFGFVAGFVGFIAGFVLTRTGDWFMAGSLFAMACCMALLSANRARHARCR